jgi:hypothetical protein
MLFLCCTHSIHARSILPAAMPPTQAVPTTIPQQNIAVTVPVTAPTVVPGNTISYVSPTPTYNAEIPRESTWSARIDYFHWKERLDGADFVNEDGAMVALNYTRRTGIERFRLEMFGSSVNYDSDIDLGDGTTDPLKSTTNYIGLGGEYELLFEPDLWPRINFFAGIGTRFWFRDLPSGYSESGYPVIGYLETWWTTYPYLGVETRRRMDSGWELYGSGRIGLTAVTFQHVSYYDVSLYPKMGLMGGMEAGVRGQRLLLAAYFQTFDFNQSNEVDGVLQPHSNWLTVGLKAGFSF